MQIVIFMQCGFACLEVGMIGHKNAKAILFKNFLDTCVGTVVWWAWGFGLARDGASGQALNDKGDAEFGIASGGLSMGNELAFMHSLAFATTTCTILSGGVAERMRLDAYLLEGAMLISVLYPILISWGWSGDGWLCAGGFVDFAGSCLVHLCGGIAALVSAIIIGPRRHRFKNGRVTPFKENSVIIAVLGTMILTFCWISFNASSTLAADAYSMALSIHAVVNTLLSMSSATLSSVLLETHMNRGKFDVAGTLNALLGGLVAVTAGCAFMSNWAALLLGVASGFVSNRFPSFLQRLEIDDPLDAATVHGANGVLGTLWLGIFARKDLMAMHYMAAKHPAGHYGFIYAGGSFSLLLIQLEGVIATIAFVGVSCLVGLLLISTLMWAMGGDTDGLADESVFWWIRQKLRIEAKAEILGADFLYHMGSAFELNPVQTQLYNETRQAQDKFYREQTRSPRFDLEEPEASTTANPTKDPQSLLSFSRGMMARVIHPKKSFAEPTTRESTDTAGTEIEVIKTSESSGLE